MNRRATPQEPSQPMRLLLVACSLPAVFTEWDLTVAAYRRDPAMWGMRGHPHPDHKKVYALLVHRKGPVGLGWIERAGKNLYRVSAIGGLKVAQINQRLAEAS